MQRIAPVHTEHCPITFRAYLWKPWSSAFGVLELCFWGQKAMLLPSKSSAFAIKKWCTRCLKVMLLKAESNAFEGWKTCFRHLGECVVVFNCLQIFENFLRALKKTVTGHRCDHVSSRPQNGHRSQVWPCYLSTTRGKWKPKMQNVSKKIICFTICYKTANILIKMSNPNGHTIWIQNDKENSNI